MKKMFLGKMSTVMAVAFMGCLAFNMTAADPAALAQGVTTTIQGVATGKGLKKDKMVTQLQQQIAVQQQKITDQQKKISDMVSNSAKQPKVDKEQKKLTIMQGKLVDMQGKLDKLKGELAPATPALANQKQ